MMKTKSDNRGGQQQTWNKSNPTKPSREQLRTQTPRTTSPRQSSRAVERSGQRRGH
jgi:hypothetical protein